MLTLCAAKKLLLTGCFLSIVSFAACVQSEPANKQSEDSTLPAAANTPLAESVSVARERGFDPAEMLAAHNQWRARVGVPDLVWSEKLADIAQQWADYLAVTSCNCHDHSGSEYGENLYWSSAMTYASGRKDFIKRTPQEVVDAWGNEAAEEENDSPEAGCNAELGHHTQLIWRDSKEVGCAMAVCDGNAQIWVCNYYPPGNIIGQRPY